MPTTTIDGSQMADLIAAFFMQAARDTTLGQRLAAAGCSVHLHVGGHAGVTLNLERTPISAEPHIVGTADVEIWGSPELFLQFVRRERHIAMAICDGDLTFRGPVRQFLRIVPILRARFRRVPGGGPAAGAMNNLLGTYS